MFDAPPTLALTAPSGPGATPIDDPAMRKLGPPAVAMHPSVFADIANVYAPYYRQADAVWALGLPPRARPAIVGVPAGDVEAALRFYLEH